MSIENILNSLSLDKVIEIYNREKNSLPVKRDYAQISWQGYENVKSLAEAPQIDEGAIQFTPNVEPPESFAAGYDLVILNDVLEYSENILLAIKNAAKLLKPDGYLLIAHSEKKYSRNCLRTSARFAESLNIYLNMGHAGSLAFDAAYNASMAYDLPSFWHSGNIVERDGLSYDQSLQIWRQAAGGRKYYLPYWSFSERSFLYFWQEAAASGLFNFSLQALVQVKEFERQFYVLLKNNSEPADRNNFIKSELTRINEMLRLYNPNQITLRGDGEDALRAQVKQWEKEYYKRRVKPEREKASFKIGKFIIKILKK